MRRQFVLGGIFFTCKNLFLLINFYVQIWKLKRVFFVKEMNIEVMLFFLLSFSDFLLSFPSQKMAPRVRDVAWAYVEMVDSQMHCKFCHRKIKEGPGGINRLKQHLAGIRGQITQCELDEIGEIRKELLANFEKFKEEKARQKELEAEIGRKRNIQKMLATNPLFDFEGSSSISCTDASNPFRYVPPSLEFIQEKGKGKMKKKGDMNIKSYFTVTPYSPSDAHGPQASRTLQPTLDDHWRKELRETACDYICRWWYDADIPFNASRSPYYEPMFDAIHTAGKGFKGPTMHEIRGYRLQKEIASI